MAYATENIRNITICGHGGTGKTTFTEHLLLNGGVISKAETVASGRTVSDFTEEEIEKKASLHLSLMNIVWKDVKMNIMDTPGASDFVGEVVSSFRAAETAIMMIDGASGIQIETIKLWRRLNHRNMPRFVFINKMDIPRADYDAVIKDVESVFKVHVVPISLPWGKGENFQGVINLLDMKAYKKDGTIEEIPADMKEQAEKYRLNLVEMAAEGDDELTEKYFENGTLEGDDIAKGLLEGIEGNTFVPAFCGAAELNSGVKPVLEFAAIAAPSPKGIEEPLMDGSAMKIEKDAHFSGLIFRTSIDKFSGKMSFVKVITGTLKPMEAYNHHADARVRLNKIYIVEGKTMKEVPELHAGDIGVVTKVEPLATNETICESGDLIDFKPLSLPHPVYSLAIHAENQKDEDKMSAYLHKIAEQDLTFTIEFNEETKQTVISGMGEQHIGMILEKLKHDSKITVNAETPRVPYRETITAQAEAEYTHKKQSGGHGQYGKVLIKAWPLDRGEDFKMTNDIKGGSISKGYMPGIEKGFRECMNEGFLAGYPLVDIGVSVYDGKEHPVDSSEMSFKIAAKNALRVAVENARPTLLEPVMNLTVYVDDQYMGDILSDLSTKRGRVQNQEPIGGGIQAITAQVPQGELMRYSIDLRSMTSGTGAFEMEFSHYEPVSGKIAQDIIDASKTA